jgi:hypothetical protein
MSIGQKPHGPLRSYGRVKARQLKLRQAALIEDLMPGLALPDPELGPIDPHALMQALARSGWRSGLAAASIWPLRPARIPMS